MRFTLPLLAAIFLSGPVGLAQTTRPTTQPAMSVSPDGTLTITLAGKAVMVGHWQIAHFPGAGLDPDETPLGDMVSSSVAVDSPNHALVTDTYPAAKVTTDIKLVDEDLHLSTRIQNQDKSKSLKKINFLGVAAHFSKPAAGTLASWHNSYLAAKGLSLFHPSLAQPIGAVYARDGQFGFAIHSNSEFDQKTLFNAEFEQNGIIPANCQLQFFTTRVVPPGGAVDLDVNVRISTDTSTAHLIEAYKKVYDQHFPALLYHPDNRPLAACTGVAEKVNRSNPYGFIGAFRRIDTAQGVASYTRLIAPALEQANALGIIFWSPGGYRPPMYPPDFDVFPDAVKDNLPLLMAGFRKHHLRVGLCARCENGVIREPGKEPVVTQLHADQPKEMQELLERFHHAIHMGFDIFYLDSFGNEDPNDQEMLKQIRDDLGPDILLYTEYSTDLSLPYAGRYCEWHGNDILWAPPMQYEALRMLCPASTWLCISKDKGSKPVPPEFAKLGLTPLVDDMLSNRLPASRPSK